jgi:hypothetical protein
MKKNVIQNSKKQLAITPVMARALGESRPPMA